MTEDEMKQVADDISAMIDRFTVINHPLISASPIALPSAFGRWSLLDVYEELRRLASNVCAFAKHVRFKQSLAWKVDHEAWETLVANLDLFEEFHLQETIHRTVEERGEQYLIERTKYLTHMLKGFRDGERFIVAKLAYDGGAA